MRFLFKLIDPLTYRTEFFVSPVYHGQLTSNDTLLIHGAGSGISSLAIQMAKVGNARVLTTIGSGEKLVAAKATHADKVINRSEDDFFDAIGENQVDVIVDFIGGDYLPKHLQLLKEDGRLIQIACMKGASSELYIPLLLRKRLTLMGFVLRSQSLSYKKNRWREAHHHWLEPLRSGTICPIIDTIFPWQEAEKAHQRLLSPHHFGKIILNKVSP